MRVLVLSDIHANLIALEAVLAAAPQYHVIWNLGDTVGYGPRPGACLDRIRQLPNAQSLAGNHDLAAIGALDTSTFNPTARLAAVWTHHQLAPGQTEFIRRLPSITHLAEATLAHGSPCSPVWEYVTSAEAATENFRCFDGPLCLIGHSHIALAARLEATRHYAELWPLAPGDIVDLDSGRFMINPGSVGQPRDHDPRAAFGVLDTGQRVYTSFRVEYDIAATQRQMEQAGLPDSLNRRLSIGV